MPDRINANEPLYEVLVNKEEQYSIWPARKAVPAGWMKVVGKQGAKEACLAYIKDMWIDMRPLSLKNQMDVSSS